MSNHYLIFVIYKIKEISVYFDIYVKHFLELVELLKGQQQGAISLCKDLLEQIIFSIHRLNQINFIFRMFKNPAQSSTETTQKLVKIKSLKQLNYSSETTNKDCNLFKKIVPVKQYSNKFFRRQKNNQFKHLHQTTQGSNKQKRVNSLMRKQKIFQSPAIRCHSNHISEFMNNSSMIAISSFSNTKQKNRVKTEVSKTNISMQNFEPSVSQIQQELILSNDFNKKLFSPSDTFLMKSNDQFVEFKTHVNSFQLKKQDIKQDRRNKISQSRGLEKYCKIFIKEKSEMVQKLWENKRKISKTIDRVTYSENQNNFEAKKIIPMEKTKKMKTLETHYCKKGMRTPMRTIQNDQVAGRLLALKDLRSNYNDDYFQINGWETSL